MLPMNFVKLDIYSNYEFQQLQLWLLQIEEVKWSWILVIQATLRPRLRNKTLPISDNKTYALSKV